MRFVNWQISFDITRAAVKLPFRQLPLEKQLEGERKEETHYD